MYHLGLMHIQFNVSDSKGKRLKASRRRRQRRWLAGGHRMKSEKCVNHLRFAKDLKEKKNVDNAKMLKVFLGNSLYTLVVVHAK